MSANSSRLVIAGLSGDAGKTLASLSLAAALRRRGEEVAVFKKGPDYIDAAWLGYVAGGVCRNLDTWLAPEAAVLGSFARHAGAGRMALIEGNRGLFDGMDAEGAHSTAELAKLLHAPVVIVVDCTKVTRTVAALIRGCQTFDPGLIIGGVVLNKVAGRRHARTITEAIEQHCGVKVLGVIPKLGSDADLIPGRHLGLVPPTEFEAGGELIQRLVDIGEDYLDVDGLLQLAATAAPLTIPPAAKPRRAEADVRIGYFSDSVFTFYYPENLEALVRQGAALTPISSLDQPELPAIDALYIGGGFPETHARQLAANASLMKSVKAAAQRGLPIYAECGGLIYLARSLTWGGETHAMAGVFDIELRMNEKPIGHGYTELTVDRDNPFFPRGAVIRGHEFHYSGPAGLLDESAGSARVVRGTGLGNGRDGLVTQQTMASYTHLHADGVPGWAEALTARARQWRARQGNDGAAGGADSRRPTREDSSDSTRRAARPENRAVPAR